MNPAGARVRNTACHGPAAFRPNVETASNRDPARGVTAPEDSGAVRGGDCGSSVSRPPRTAGQCVVGTAGRRLGSAMARRENPRCGRRDCGRFCLASACAVFRAPLALRMLCGKPVEETEETSARAMLERDPARESPPRWGLSLSSGQHPSGAGRGGARLCTPRPGGPSAPGPPPGQLLWPAPLQPDLLGREDRIGKAG